MPTGVPTTHSGFVPMEYDTTDNRLYLYNSGWQNISGAGGATALSGITAATAVHSFDSTSMAQTWTWNSLTTQTAFTLSSSSLTNGNILSIQNTAASATSTGKVLSISDATTGSGYGVYSSMTGHLNTGYAGYFLNTDTSTNTNYGVYGIINSTTTAQSAGVYGEGDCASCAGVKAVSNNDFGVSAFGGWAGIYTVSNGTGTNYGIYSQETGHGNTGYAGYFLNTDTGADTNYGVWGQTASSSGVGVYGTSANNGTGVYGFSGGTGYAGYFYNNSAAAGYGVYGTITGHGNTGYAGYFVNTDTSSNRNFGVYGAISAPPHPAPTPPASMAKATAANCGGVYGYSANGTGVLGLGNGNGIYAQYVEHRRRRWHLRHDHRPRQHRLCRLLHQYRHKHQPELRRLRRHLQHHHNGKQLPCRRLGRSRLLEL